MNCPRVREEIKAYIDGELNSLTRWRVARHIATCDNCRREMQEMTELTNKVQTATNVSAPSGLRDNVMGRLAFEPTRVGQSRPKWRHYADVAVTFAIVGVLAAIITPTFYRAKEDSEYARRLVCLNNLKKCGQALKMYSNEPEMMAAPSPSPGMMKSRHVAPASAPQMIIKTAELGIRVRSYDRASDEAVSIVKSSGGYVTDTSASSDQGIPTEGTMTLRVPVDKFENTLTRLAKLGTVTSRSITGDDVTGEAVDLDSRLRNLRAEERQYLEIMNRAKRIPDVVTVTNELARVRGDIEEAQGRLKYLKSSAAMSTINLSISEKKREQPHKSALGTSFGNASASLLGTLSGLASIAIWLIVYSPFWALPMAAWLYIRKRIAQPTV